MSTSVNPLLPGMSPVIDQVDQNLLDRAVCITLSFNSLGNRKRVDSGMIRVRGEKAEEKPEPEEMKDGISEDDLPPANIEALSQTLSEAMAGLDPVINDQPNQQIQDPEFMNPESEPDINYDTQTIPAPPSSRNVDRTMLGVSKQLLDSKELKAVRKLDSEIRRYIYSKCLPYKIAIHLLPYELVDQVEAALQLFSRQRFELIEKFLVAYPEQISAAEKRLTILFNEGDYKNLDSVRAAFEFDWQYLNFSTPGKLRDISPALFQAEQEKQARKWAEASETIQQVMRVQMRELVKKLNTKLSPDEDGKSKSVRKGALDGIREFIEDFDVRNITSDAELKAVVERAKAILANVDTTDLKTSDELRGQFVTAFAAIQNELSGIIVEESDQYLELDD